MSEQGTGSAERSGFISGLAWVFIVLGAFSTVVALFQSLLLAAVLPSERLQALLHRPDVREALPDYALWVFQHVQLLAGASLLFSVFMLVAAIALLKRRRWARWTFVVFMVLSAVTHFVGAWLILTVPMPVSVDVAPGGREAFEMMRGVFSVMRVVAAVLGVVFGIGFAWLARRLLSREVGREFAAAHGSRVRFR